MSCLVCRETRLAVYSDLELSIRLMDLQGTEITQVSVCIIALSECQLVQVVMRLEILAAVVQESAHRSTSSFILVDDQNQSVELGRRV